MIDAWVRLLDGVAVDYTVEVTDALGSFYVWARTLDRALELQWKTGDARGFNLRAYEVDFANLDEVGSADESRYRVETLTPAQFHFATSLGGVDFQPAMLRSEARKGRARRSARSAARGDANARPASRSDDRRRGLTSRRGPRRTAPPANSAWREAAFIRSAVA